MAVLVTGGAGYIGSVAVERLLRDGEDVVVLDNFSTGHRDAVAPEARLVEGDIRDDALLARLFAERPIDTVMHFAAFIEVGESVENPRKYFENNVEGAHAVIKAMLDAGVPRFILSSTAAVYGNPEGVPITEDMPARPINPYGISKRMVEQILEWYGSAYGVQYGILRYFNACGATEERGEDHHPESHLIPNILMAAAGERERILVFGDDYDTPDGTCVRDYIHVADLAEAHLLAMNHLRKSGESVVANLGNAVGNSVLEVIETVKRVTGRDFEVTRAPRRPGDAARLVASSSKARALLGWQPEKGDIESIVRDAWQWRQARPHGYAR